MLVSPLPLSPSDQPPLGPGGVDVMVVVRVGSGCLLRGQNHCWLPFSVAWVPAPGSLSLICYTFGVQDSNRKCATGHSVGPTQVTNVIHQMTLQGVLK